MLKKIFGPRRNEVTGVWRKLHNEELHDLFSSPNTFQVSKLEESDGQGMRHIWRERLLQGFDGET
jgi:hypothetical protein